MGKKLIFYLIIIQIRYIIYYIITPRLIFY